MIPLGGMKMSVLQVRSVINWKRHMKMIFRNHPAMLGLSLVFTLLTAGSASALAATQDAAGSGRALEDISYSSLPGNRVQIKLSP